MPLGEAVSSFLGAETEYFVALTLRNITNVLVIFFYSFVCVIFFRDITFSYLTLIMLDLLYPNEF